MLGWWRGTVIGALGLALFGCGSSYYYTKGIKSIEQGHVDQGLSTLQEGLRKYPDDTQLRAGLLSQKFRVLESVLELGDRALAAGRWQEAISHYQHAAQLDPGNPRASTGLENVARAQRHAAMVTQAASLYKKGEDAEASAILQRVLAENPTNSVATELQRQIDDKRVAKTFEAPTLNTLYHGPVNLEFRDSNIKVVLEILSKTSGVNFALDKDVNPNLSITLFVQQASLEDAVNLMLRTYQLKKKIINDKTVLIYPDTPDKERQYEELAVKAIYLTNIDSQKMAEIIRAMVKTNEIIVEPRLNMLILRDNIDAIRAAEKLVSLLDVPEPEIMLELEVLEVQTGRLHDLGIQFPNQVDLNVLSSSGSNGGTTSGNSLTLNDLNHINSSRIGISGLSATLNLRKELSDANVLANPSIRTRNREKAVIKIGDRVPVISTTQNTTSNSTSDSVQYLDVGLNVEVEPDVRMDNEVTLKLALEVSNIVKEIRGGNGSIAYQIGTRNANTVLQLRDGETQILGGLIRHDESLASNRVPGLGDLPILGRLFSSDLNQNTKTEIVLAITPHILRNVTRPAASESMFWSGTDQRFTLDHPWENADRDGRIDSHSAPTGPRP